MRNRISLRSIVLGLLVCVAIAVLTVYSGHRKGLTLSATQLPVLSMLLLVIMVLLINPLLRLIRIIRPFNVAELLIIFVMGMVSSGVSTFGLADQIVPIVGSLYYREWNHDQSEWSRYIGSFVDDDFFLSREGITDAAATYHGAYEALLADRDVYDSAARFRDAEARAALAREKFDAASAAASGDQAAGLKLALARAELDAAEAYTGETRREWLVRAAARAIASRDDALRDYPEIIAKDEDAVAVLKRQLDEAEKLAFDRVQLFRRGLPRHMRSYPGIIPIEGDNARGYWERLRRLYHGLAALRSVRAASRLMERPSADEAIAALRAACDELAPVSSAQLYNDLEQTLRAEEAKILAHKLGIEADLKEMEREYLNASRSRIYELDHDMARQRRIIKRVEKERLEVVLDIEKNAEQRYITARVADIIASVASVADGLESGAMPAPEAVNALNAIVADFPSIDASLRRYFFGEVPWGHWIEPLVRWSFYIGLTYVLLMALNMLLFRQWAHNEKLTYPLMELPKALLPPEHASSSMPAMFRNNLFWLGFFISASVLGWNFLCSTQLIPGLLPFDFSNFWQPYVEGKAFHPLIRARCMIFFTMIGISFIIPKNISFSLWFFHVVYMIQLLIMCWAGHGVDERSFPSDWYYMLNFRSAQGQGAIMVFALFVLFKCRRYLLCAFRPSLLEPHLEADERRELRIASAVFVLGSALLILMFWLDMGAGLGNTIFAYFVIIVITIGLVRAVTEGGLLGFQAWVSPFHFIRAFFGLNKSWTAPAFFAPLLIYYSILFLDIKTFIAPAMANSLKLREDFRLRRGAFHFAVFLAIAVSSIAAVVYSIMMAYSPGGADSMSSWFYKGLPQWTFDTLRSMIKDSPQAAESARNWTLAGAGVMALLMFLRQYIFWLPHPLGLVMFVNPIMGAYWFSIFIGWLVNVAVTKYGNKDSFQRAKGLFIGLVIGELFMVALSLVFVIFFQMGSPISLNRN